MTSSFQVPWSFPGYAIAVSIPVEWILRPTIWQIISIPFAANYGEEELKSGLWHKIHLGTNHHAWDESIIVSNVYGASPFAPNSGGTLCLPVIRADRQWWMAISVRTMNIMLTLSINDISLMSIDHKPWKYVRWTTSTISVAVNWDL